MVALAPERRAGSRMGTSCHCRVLRTVPRSSGGEKTRVGSISMKGEVDEGSWQGGPGKLPTYLVGLGLDIA